MSNLKQLFWIEQKLYKPKKYIIEKQRDFKINLNDYKINPLNINPENTEFDKKWESIHITKKTEEN